MFGMRLGGIISSDCSVRVKCRLRSRLMRSLRANLLKGVGGFTIVASSGILSLCTGPVDRGLDGTKFGIRLFMFPTKRGDGAERAGTGVRSTVLRGKFHESYTIVTVNKNIIASLTKFLTKACNENMPFVGCTAALLTTTSTSINKGATISAPLTAGLVKLFGRPHGICVSVTT